jgi:4-amino-4-deoxy-L-arabinose transferase-like glycosyltransferase
MTTSTVTLAELVTAKSSAFRRVLAPSAERRKWYAAIAVVAGATLLRLALAGIVPLDPDEAYDWEWSRRLAPGYYDHPPVTALLIHAGVALLGPSALGVRFMGVLAGGLGTLAVVALGRRLGGSDAALRTAILLACLPVTGVLLGVATPDTPLLACAALVLGAVERALAAARGSKAAFGWWLLAGLALGAALCSKYTAVLLPLGVLAALLVSPALRKRLTEVGPYAACLVALAVFAPVVLWNGERDWVSFRHQLGHGFGAPTGSPLLRELDLLGGQLALASPILFVLLLVAVVRAVRLPSNGGGFVLAAVASTTLAFFAVSALRRPVHANWPAVAYLPGAVLLALIPGGRIWNRWFYAGCALGGAMLLGFYVQAAQPFLLLGARTVPPGSAHGWVGVAERVAVLRDAMRLPGVSTWVAANRYQDAAELAFHLGDHPTVFSLNINGRLNQYDLWPCFPQMARTGDALLLVLEEGREMHVVVESLAPHFALVKQGELVSLCGAGQIISQRRIWVFEGWRGTWLTTPGPDSPR